MSEWRKSRNSSDQIGTHPPDAMIASLAERNHGCVCRAELFSLGQTRDQILHRLHIGRLRPVFPGVYAVGGVPLGLLGTLRAATLWAGAGSAISHRTAAALWGILPAAGPIHLTSPRRLSGQAGIVLHRRLLPADEVTTREGVPVTALCRTLLDIAAEEGASALSRAIREADYRRLTDRYPLAELIARHPGSRGTAIAARVLVAEGPVGHTESELEEAFVGFLRARAIPLPQLNVPLALGARRIRVDCLWSAERVVVELDGRRAHDTDERFETDRARDLVLLSHDYAPARVTWRRLHGDADGLERDLRNLLSRRQPVRAAA